jgi:hypothetical protein
MSQSRKDVLLKALEAEAGAASVDLGTLFTGDVVGWSPYATVSGLAALADLAALREVAFSNVIISLRGLDEVGNRAFAEWLIEADHTGPYVLGEDAVLEATGRHVQLAGVTVADFRGGKIRSFRTYFDDLSLIEQIAGAFAAVRDVQRRQRAAVSGTPVPAYTIGVVMPKRSGRADNVPRARTSPAMIWPDPRPSAFPLGWAVPRWAIGGPCARAVRLRRRG